MSGESLELTLEGMAYGGDAFGREPGGRMVFVPYAAPGERVRVQPTEVHRTWARAALLEVFEPSPHRVTPRCRHFGQCGGCHYQHLSYPAQLEVKADVVRSQLMRLGGFQAPPVQPTEPSPSPWNTRNHVQFSLTPEGRLGFQAVGSHRVIPIEECHLPELALTELWLRLDLEPIPGLQRVAVRAGHAGETMVVLEGQGEPEIDVHLDVDTSLVWLGARGVTVLAGSDHLTIDVLGRSFRASAGSFFQVHTALAEALVRRVLNLLDPRPSQVIYDLYAGVGLFSAFLAQAGAAVVAVEQSESACRDFEINLDEFDRVTLYAAPVELALPAIEPQPDAVLVDPPRSGLGPQVTQALIGREPARVVMVSCDPATLARDGRQLSQAGYVLHSVIPFDLFPQTYHIETVSLWEHKPGASPPGK
ncbi:MAG: class I SAM-dependent RNA methyltransferase [Chloroflexota bacterium]